MKKWAIFIIMLIIVSLYAYIQFKPIENNIDVDDIDFSNTQLPKSWICTWCKDQNKVEFREWVFVGEGGNWENDFNPIPFSTKLEDRIQGIYWFHEDNSKIVMDLVEVVVIEYNSLFYSKVGYFFENPEGVYQKVYWNFTYDKDNIHPTDWKFINEFADKDEVLCGNGSQERCSGWFYRARYGQYYLTIKSTYAMSTQVFQSIVESILPEFEKYIR